MQKMIVGILFIAAALLTYFMLPLKSSAAEFTCKIQAGRQDAYVIVTDYDRDGNPMRQRGERFQGVIKKGQRQTIKSVFGKIRYGYRLYNQSRSNGRNFANCEGGKIIKLP